MYTNFYKKLTLIFVFVVGINLSAALPGNISILVDKSAPAVVNITATKDVSKGQSYSLRGLPIPDEMLERFGIPRNSEIFLNKKGKLFIWFWIHFKRQLHHD